MIAREQFEAQFAALAALPWVRTADRLPSSPHTNGRWVVLIGPTPAKADPPGTRVISRGTGRIAANIAIARFTETGWTWHDPNSFSRSPPIHGEVVAWLDLNHWHLDQLVEHLYPPADPD